ncbi:helix-turn-helix domain-containing protein [Kitasatospora sp. NPDC018619]|uniref:helix-turn-helix domain-containing protein n=1 Tax=unclassified Kitasatospora TaxID=2633591 RepID=UPI0037A51573
MLNHEVDHGAPAELAGELGLSRQAVEAAVEYLLASGLLRVRSGGRLVAVAPDEAASEVLGPLEREIRTRRATMDRTRRDLMSFMPAFEASISAQQHRNQFQLIRHLADVRSVIADLADHCQEEILTAQPGGGHEVSALAEAAPRDEDLLRRDVRMKVLYQHTAGLRPDISGYIERITKLGAQVRTLDDRFTRMLVFDRKAAVIAVPGNPHAAALVREPHMVAVMVEVHERLWLAAEPFTVGTSPRAEITDDLRRVIVRLLIEGMTDASIATRLGISVRTCRRHIAEIMAAMGAQSRLQAGYLLAAQERAGGLAR